MAQGFLTLSTTRTIDPNDEPTSVEVELLPSEDVQGAVRLTFRWGLAPGLNKINFDVVDTNQLAALVSELTKALAKRLDSDEGSLDQFIAVKK